MSSELGNSGNKQLTTQERDQIPVHNKALDGIVIFNKTTNQLERLRDRVWQPLIGDSASFLALSDTPSNFTGSIGKATRVNSSGTGLEFYDPSSTTNTYTIQIGNSADTEFTINHPLNTKFVQVSILESVTGHEVEADKTIPSLNTVIVKFSIPPNVNEFTIVVTK